MNVLGFRSTHMITVLRAVGSPEEVFRSGILDEVFGIRLKRTDTERLMTYPKVIPEDEYAKIRDALYTNVYRVSCEWKRYLNE